MGDDRSRRAAVRAEQGTGSRRPEEGRQIDRSSSRRRSIRGAAPLRSDGVDDPRAKHVATLATRIGRRGHDATRRAGTRTLFLRENQKSFVDIETGVVSLEAILLPIDDGAEAEEAWLWATSFKRLLAPDSRVYLLHVGSAAPSHVGCIEGPIDVRRGPPVETILRVAAEIDADIIVIPTAGPEGLLNALRGSLMERVLRESPCPVLAIPMDYTGDPND